MPKLLFVFDSKNEHDAVNLLNNAQQTHDLPEGVEQVLAQAWTVDFPKCASFLSKLCVAADAKAHKYHVYEIASPSSWEFQAKQN